LNRQFGKNSKHQRAARLQGQRPVLPGVTDREPLILADGRAALRSQTATLKRGQHIKYPPHAFTEHGATMAAMVLNSPQAVAMSVYVVRAFSRMREHLAANAAILKRLAEIDRTLLQHDSALRDIYHKLLPLLQPPPEPPKRRIGFAPGD
jgi:hypothetical protein